MDAIEQGAVLFLGLIFLYYMALGWLEWRHWRQRERAIRARQWGEMRGAEALPNRRRG